MKKPDVRLSITNDGMPSKQERYPMALSNKESPTIKLAHVPGAQGDNVLIGRNGVLPLPDTSLPALLISFYYLEAWEINQHKYHYRDWVMDSGAFSAHNSGVEIKLQDYIDCCKRLIQKDQTLTEVYALDVIGDHEGSLANTEEMWRQGIPAIPCFHAGEPWDALTQMAKNYPKIALGGVALAKSGMKMAWAKQCFARVWPKKIHGFAFSGESQVLGLPWHSVDSTSWEIGPCAFGRWNSFGGNISVRGSAQNLRPEVEFYLELERKARERWKKEMKLLEELSPTIPLTAYPEGTDLSQYYPNIKLVVGTGRSVRDEGIDAMKLE